MNKNLFLNRTRRNRDYVLLTGATGLVGSYLMRDLFLLDRELAVIVRPSKRLNPQLRVEAIMRRWEQELGQTLPRPVVFEGDVCDTNLGLDDDALRWISEHCQQIIHSAAVLQFDGATMADEPWRTNLGGTQNVLDFARRVQIPELHYVSTAYVCGKQTDRVFESDLDRSQEFRNDYERSKFEAEKLVHADEFLTNKTIYRPAVIVGDSQTGYTSTYHGLFLYLRLIATLVPQQRRNSKGVIETSIQLPMDGDEPRNLVPVDWVSQVISHLFCSPEACNQTFHLTPDHFVTARDVINDCYEYFNSSGVEFCGKHAPRQANNEFATRFFENVRQYESYETSDPSFDKENVRRFAKQFPCPRIDKATIWRFLEFGKANRWGKRREPIPEIQATDPLAETTFR